MKKYILFTGLLCLTSSLFSQTHADALRYSQNIIGGTARSVAMGGAFGALGGDFSTLSTNPAGLAVYRGSELTFSPEIYSAGTTSRYYGNETEERKFNLNLSNFGYVATFKEEGSFLKSVNFGIGYNRIANFHRNTIVSGFNPSTSYADFMVADANTFGLGSNSNTFGYFTTSLFYDAYLMDYDTLSNEYYLSNDYFDNDGDFRTTEQVFTVNEWGKINEWAFSLGFNFNDMLFLGGTFGIQPLYYEFEKNTEEYRATDPNYQYSDFYESLNVSGTGYTAKFGMIFKPIQVLRLGAAIHLPVSYFLNEKYTTSISFHSPYNGNWETYKPVDDDGYDLDYQENDYKIVTPFKAIGSVGIVLGKFLVLSSDIEYIDYSSMRLDSDNDNYSDVNSEIRTVYRDNINLKMGGELKMGTLYFRGGGGYYGSPYTKGDINENAYKYSVSCGFGIREKSYFFDVAYQYTSEEEQNLMYVVDINEGGSLTTYTNPANIDLKSGRLLTTIGFRF